MAESLPCPDCMYAVSVACPDPVDLLGQPIGMYHCPGCGVMQVAGFPHIACDRCGGTHRLKVETVRGPE